MKMEISKRQQEINEAAGVYARMRTADKDMQITFADAYRAGARWADEQMINKACKWLDENCAIFWESPCNPQNIVVQFKKAMEGDEQ